MDEQKLKELCGVLDLCEQIAKKYPLVIVYAEGLQSSIPIDVQRLVLATLPGRALVSCVTVSRLWSRILLAPPFLHRWRFTCQLCKHLLPFSANGKEDCWFHPKEPRWEIDYYDGGKYFVHWECCGRKNPNDPGCQTRPHSRFIVPWPPYFQLLDANTIHRIVSFMDYWAVGTFSGVGKWCTPYTRYDSMWHHFMLQCYPDEELADRNPRAVFGLLKQREKLAARRAAEKK